MAHSPEIKATAFGLFNIGRGIHDVAGVLKSEKVGKSTVQDWHREWSGSTGNSTVELKKDRFITAVERFATASMDMLSAQAELLTDPSYLAKASTSDVVAHTKFLLEAFMLIQSRAGSSDTSALPERCEVIVGEPVEEL